MLPTHCHRRVDVATVDDIAMVRDWAMALADTWLPAADRNRLDRALSAMVAPSGHAPKDLTVLLRGLPPDGVECLAFDRDSTEHAASDPILSHHTPGVGNARLARVWASGRAPAIRPTLVEAGSVMTARPGGDRCGDGWFFRCDGADHGVALLIDGQPIKEPPIKEQPIKGQPIKGPPTDDARARRIEAVVAATTPGLSPQMVIGAIRRDLAALPGNSPVANATTDAAADAAAIVRLSGDAVDYTALGTVAGAVIRNRTVTSLAARWAMVGYNPQIPACVHLQWGTGDHVILHSDGCSRLPVLFVERGLHRLDPTLAAAVLLRDGAVGDDDRTIMVLRNRACAQAASREAA